jgi:hypothetical protein
VSGLRISTRYSGRRQSSDDNVVFDRDGRFTIGCNGTDESTLQAARTSTNPQIE